MRWMLNTKILFEPCISSGRPGTPSCFFQKSWKINVNTGGADMNQIECATQDATGSRYQMVHQHANGLCIVTAGNIVQCLADPSVGIDRFVYLVQATSEQSVCAKKKQRTKARSHKASGRSEEGSIGCNDTIGEVLFCDGTKIELKACVSGKILELNDNLKDDPSLLTKDPLLDGYLAIISPSGGYFPPSIVTQSTMDPM